MTFQNHPQPVSTFKTFRRCAFVIPFCWFGKSYSFNFLPTKLCTSIIYYHLSTILAKFYFKCKIDIYLDPIYLKIQWIENKNTVPFCDQLKLKLEKLDIDIFLKIRVEGNINTCKYKHSSRFGGQLPVLKRLNAIVLLMYNRWFLSLYIGWWKGKNTFLKVIRLIRVARQAEPRTGMCIFKIHNVHCW